MFDLSTEDIAVLQMMGANAIGLLLGFIFGRSCAHKFGSLRRFGELVDAYALLPSGSGRWIAPLMALAELSAGVLCTWPPSRHHGALLVMVLLLAYGCGVGINLLRGNREIDCGCGGRDREAPLSGWLLLRIAILLALAMLLLYAPPPRVLGVLVWIGSFTFAGIGAAVFLLSEILLARDTLLADD